MIDLEYQSTDFKRKWVYTLILPSLLSLLVIFAIFLYINKNFIVTPLLENEGLNTTKEVIHLTLRPIDGSLPQGLYFFNLASGKLKRLETSFSKKGIPVITSKSSPNNKRAIAFVSGDTNGLGQIYVKNKALRLEKITKSSTPIKLSPEWAPSGDRLAFSAIESMEYAGSLIPEDWGVYVTDLEGNEIFISNGAYPKWSPSGEEILFMKNDGLYVYKSNGEDNGVKVWEMDGGSALLSMKLDVSPDGRMFAWSNIADGEVFLAKIESWTPFRAKEYARISTHAFWPVFSPDSHSIAVQEIDYNAKESNPRLVIYNLETFDREEVLDLKDYVQTGMFVSDWQPKRKWINKWTKSN